ncbi:MAG: aldo/keto reductase [Clostridiales bacterium]|nr:aldo/keto reductase [Clostridiales bacterium]
MKYQRLGRTGFDISAVTYGGIVSASLYDGRSYKEDGQPDSDRQVMWAIEQGVNYFDVAPTYGNAQEMLGTSLKPFRKDVFLACKTGKRLRAEAEPEMLESLKILKTDYFDVYQMHALSTMQDVDLAFGPGGIMEMMRDMKEKGMARNLGITAHSEDVALRAIELYDFDTVLFPFNWHMHMAYGMGDRLLKKAREKNMGILCMKSMIERAWTGPEERYASKYPKSWCRPFDTETQTDLLMAGVRYVQGLGVHTIVPPGNFDHFSFAVRHIDELLSRPISEEEKALLKQHLEEVREWPFFQPGKETK